MQKYIAICLLVVGILSPTSFAKFCGSITLFDHVCTLPDETVLVLSFFPCYSRTYLSFTAMRTGPKDPFFYNLKTNTSQPLLRIGNQTVAYRIEIHDHWSKDLYKDVLHVTVMSLDDASKKLNFRDIFNVVVPMHPTKCRAVRKLDYPDKEYIPSLDGDGFLKSSYCDNSMHLGDFSTVCYKQSKGVFLTILNICDVPYSVTVVAINSPHDVEVIERFTDKNADIIPLKAAGVIGGDECGVMLTMFHVHGFSHEKQHTRLAYVCKNAKHSSMVIIDDSYYTTRGLVCPETMCKEISTTKHICTNNITLGNGSQVAMTTKMQINICKKKVISLVEITVPGFPQRFSARMKWSDRFTIRNNTKRYMFNLGSRNRSLHTGYLPVDGGSISLYAVEEPSVPAVHVMILRHYPGYEDAYPLVRNTFNFRRGDPLICRSKSKSSSLWIKIVIPILVILLATVLLIIFYKWRQLRKLRSRDGGLPYHIELDQDDGFEE